MGTSPDPVERESARTIMEEFINRDVVTQINEKDPLVKELRKQEVQEEILGDLIEEVLLAGRIKPSTELNKENLKRIEEIRRRMTTPTTPEKEEIRRQYIKEEAEKLKK